MSADNRIVLTIHPLGGFTLVSQQDSDEGPVRVWDHSPRFDTFNRAVAAYAANNGYGQEFWSEYGLSVSHEAANARPEVVFWYDPYLAEGFDPSGFFIVSNDYSIEQIGLTLEFVYTFKSGVTFNRDGVMLPPVDPNYPESHYSSHLVEVCTTYPKPVGE